MKIENVDIRINDIDHIWYNNKQYISLNRVNQMLRDKRTETQGITDEQAIEHLQSTGWMQNHDREMYESGFRECLSGDGGSYDSLLPETHDKHTKTHACDNQYCIQNGGDICDRAHCPIGQKQTFYDDITDEQEQLDFVQKHERIPVVIKAETHGNVIYRADAIEAIKDADVLVSYDTDTDTDDACELAIRATKGSVIESVKALSGAEPEQRWIPVTERLPEPRMAVLGYAPKYQNIYALYYDSAYGWMIWNPIRDDCFPNSQGEIVAWMPLPEPYSEE